MRARVNTEQALLHGLIGIGVVAIIAKIHRWDESAMFFDGGSLGAHFLSLPLSKSGVPGPTPSARRLK